MNKGVLATIIICVMLVLFGGGFLIINSEEEENSSENTDNGLGQYVKTTEYKMSLGNYFYNPNRIVAEPGERIVVQLDVENGMHDFVIDELDVKSSTIQEGGQETIEFTIPGDATSGTTYTFYCSIGNHRALGMTGTITVK